MTAMKDVSVGVVLLLDQEFRAFCLLSIGPGHLLVIARRDYGKSANSVTITGAHKADFSTFV